MYQGLAYAHYNCFPDVGVEVFDLFTKWIRIQPDMDVLISLEKGGFPMHHIADVVTIEKVVDC